MTIDPIAFSLGPFSVHWYGIILATSMVLAVWLSAREGTRLGMDGEVIFDAAIIVLPAAIIGARLYEVFVLQWPYYSQNLSEIPAVWHGGLAIHGGVIGGLLAGAIFAWVRNLDFLQWTDVVAPYLILAQAIGRWGNFINQEAYGSQAPQWVIDLLPSFIRDQMYIQGAYMHPTFLYESLWNLFCFGLLLTLRKFNPKRGMQILSYFVLYNVGRFFIEAIRVDSSFLAGGWRVAQVTALSLVVLGIVGLVLVWIREKKRYDSRISIEK